jgi:hypothetical protein
VTGVSEGVRYKQGIVEVYNLKKRGPHILTLQPRQDRIGLHSRRETLPWLSPFGSRRHSIPSPARFSRERIHPRIKREQRKSRLRRTRHDRSTAQVSYLCVPYPGAQGVRVGSIVAETIVGVEAQPVGDGLAHNFLGDVLVARNAPQLVGRSVKLAIPCVRGYTAQREDRHASTSYPCCLCPR